MRRSDREIKDRQDILDVLNKCDVIRLGINTPDYPYIVPMNFGIEAEGQSLTLWFHCAPEGLKLNLIKNNHRVGFEADCLHKLIPDENENACGYTMEYESVIGCGDISVCGDNADKLGGLKSIMHHYDPSKDFIFSDTELTTVCVLKLDVMQVTGKRLKK